MARSRNIKPAIMDNEELAELDPLVRLLFIYLWMLADREGRLEDRPKRIAAKTMPYDREADVNAMLDELHRAGFIVRYKSAGIACIQIVNFAKHQVPHVRESASELPGIDQENAEKPEICPENTEKHNLGSAKASLGDAEHCLGDVEASPRSPDSLFSDSLLLIPDTGGVTPPAQADPAKAKKKPRPAKEPPSPEFEAAWRDYPSRPGNSKVEAWRQWQARLKEGSSVQELSAGVRAYAAHCRANRVEPQYVKHARTFFGPDRHFASDWGPPKVDIKRDPPWLSGTGFDNEHEARNFGCTPSTASHFRDRKRVVPA